MLKMTTETLDAVPEAFRDAYEKTETGYRLKVEGVEDTSGLKSALQKERDRAKAADAYVKLGLTPEEIAELKSAKEKADDEAARKAGDFEALLNKHKESASKEIEARETKAKALEGKLADLMLGDGLTKALLEAGATKEGVELLSRVLRDRARLEVSDGGARVTVLDADGTPMLHSGKDATLSDLALEAAGKYPALFKSQVKAGSGTQSASQGAGRTGQSSISAADLAAMTQVQKAKFFSENPNATVLT